MVATSILVLKVVALVSVLFHAHLTKRYLRGLFLALALWILIPGFDELITFPLAAALGLPIAIFMLAYYGLGLVFLFLALGVFG